MAWLLLILVFTEPDAPNAVSTKGPYATQAQCEAAFSRIRYGNVRRPSGVCIPVPTTGGG